MAFGKLYTYDGTPRGLFPRVVANYEGVELDVVKANPWEGTSDEFKSKFPMNKVPAFEAGEFKLSECIAISAYIAKSNGDKANLLASKGSVEEQAAVLQWCSWANAHLLMSLGQWFSPLLGRVPYNKNAVEGAKTQFNGIADYLEKSLVKQTFLAGERISLADIYVAAVIGRGLEFVLEPSWRQAHPAIMRHFLTVTNQEAFKKTGVSYKLCDKAIVYTPPKKEEKPKAAAAPKEKAAPAPAPAAEEDKPAPKPKHPCEALGPATCFPIDEFKRQYSNLDTPDAMKWLEQNVNTQEYSFAKVMYKYNDELTQVFMSSNLIGGFHARLEASRKYLFGSMGVYGVSNNSKIAGAYMFRGQDYKAIFEVAPDWESYEFTPLDWNKPEDREYIRGCWTWDNKVDGLEYADGKVFK